MRPLRAQGENLAFITDEYEFEPAPFIVAVTGVTSLVALGSVIYQAPGGKTPFGFIDAIFGITG